MEFFFLDPNIERLAPEKTRILDLRAEPDRDGSRLRVFLELTPFQERPLIDLVLKSPDGNEAASTSVVEPVGWKLELTLHNRTPDQIPGSYSLSASLSYPELGEVDRRQITIEIASH